MFRRARPILLGRWNVKKAGRKAELANHDHCGGPACSQTRLTRLTRLTRTDYDNTMDVELSARQSTPKEKK
jgi:hypothetical protein